jgi:argininosuccinate synthase
MGSTTLLYGFAGNDSLRFTTAMMALAPGLRLTTVQELCGSDSAANRDLTMSSNIWGHSFEAGPLSDPAAAPPPSIWNPGVVKGGEIHELGFDQGVPTTLVKTELPLVDLISALNAIGKRLGTGTTDLVEDGHVGLKTRAIYDAPAAAILVAAHADLERIVCSRRENQFKRLVDSEWTELVYDGFWFDPARRSLDKYIDEINDRVCGSVTVFIGNSGTRVIARASQNAIYDEAFCIYRAGNEFGVQLISELAMQQCLAARLRARQLRRATSSTILKCEDRICGD